MARVQAEKRGVTGASGLVIVLAIGIANMSNYAFQIVTGRFLGTEEYGLLGGLMAVITVIGVSAASVQTSTAAAIAAGRSDPSHRRFFDPFTRSTIALSLVLGAIVLALSPLLSKFFNIGALPVMALALYLTPAALTAIATGRFQGTERFAAMAWFSSSLAVAKFVGALIVLALGFRVTALMGSLVATVTVGSLVGLWLSRDAGGIESRVFSPDVRRAFVAFTLFWVIVSMDVPLARAFFSENDAGIYAAAAVMGKAVLWLPTVVAQIVFPRLAERSSKGEAVAPTMIKALLLSLALALAAVMFIFVFGNVLFSTLYGEDYLPASDLAWKLGLATIPFAIANMLVFHHLARESDRFLRYLLAAAIVEPLLLVLVHTSGDAYAVVIGVVGFALMCALIPRTGWERIVNVVRRHREVLDIS